MIIDWLWSLDIEEVQRLVDGHSSSIGCARGHAERKIHLWNNSSFSIH